MAGGKDTPRQKLIALMYLVLMAMLAMNVSAAILDKFYFLDKSLMSAVKEENTTSNSIVASMKDKVVERGNKPNEKAAYDLATEVRDKADEIATFIVNLRTDLTEKSGGEDETTHKPKGMKDKESVAQLMIGVGDKKNGQAYVLQKKIEGYLAWLNQEVITNKKWVAKGAKPLPPLESITKSAKEDPLFQKDDHQKGKDWVQLNFDETPMIAAMASLSDLSKKVVSAEHEALNVLKQQVGIRDMSFDKVVGMYRLKSATVAAGTDLEGDIFVTAFSSTVSPSITLNGAKIAVEDGIGKFKRKVSATAYDKDGFSAQKYSAAITMNDTTLKFPVEYVVSKPVIQVQSSSVQALYRNCGNELTINVPALGSYYNPTFSLGGGEGVVKKNPRKKNEVVIIPKTKKVNLTVTNEGNKIGTETFSVRLVPKPGVTPLYKGQPVDLKRGITGSPRSLALRVEADPSFKEFLPKDAQYRITSWEAILVRGKRPVTKRTFSGSNGTLNGFNARPGDRILIEVKNLVRRTYSGGSETVKLPSSSSLINIPIN